MTRKRLFYIVFFAGLVVAFYAAVSFLVPGFGKPKINPIGAVRPFTFINQDGRTVTEKALEGKVAAVEYFFTTCKGICPRMNNNMRAIYEAYKNEPDFLILSHTSDPATDSAARLKRYADSMQVNTDRWVFLTGRKDSLYNMARYAYKIDDPANNLQSPEEDFLHTQFIALVDREGHVVKIYDGLKKSELAEMKERIGKELNK
ncbi:MAG TPA: SCO family protein [Chitinophagaceae bacterium]|jgi:protein SCO1/2|nr:SCO family protein [Chitinophagaceae bacterium]